MTSNRPPPDPIFIDFEKNWRQFISRSPEVALPVIRPESPQAVAWEPLVVAECVFSADAGALVPQVTLTWNEPAGGQPPGVAAERPVQTASPPGVAAAQPSPAAGGALGTRVDLAVHYDGFSRNFYSTALSSNLQQRFNLPTNSSIIADPEAVMLTGPALFPKLMDFRAETLAARDTNQQFTRRTLVLRDLSQGLTYRIRLSDFLRGAWHENREYAFLTPVCPESF